MTVREVYSTQVPLQGEGYAGVAIRIDRRKVYSAVQVMDCYDDECASASLSPEDLENVGNALLNAANSMRMFQELMKDPSFSVKEFDQP